MRTFAVLLLVASALGAAGCGDESLTEIVVVVDTDLAVPAQLNRVQIVVEGPGGVAFDQGESLSSPGMLPLTLSLTPAGSSLGPIRVRAIGTGMVNVTQVATTGFVKNKRRMLRMILTADCVGRPCDTDATCRGGECVPDYVSPDSLPEWTGSPPPHGDGGMPPPMDGGPPPDDGGPPPEDGGMGCNPVDRFCPCATDAECMDSQCFGGTCVPPVAGDIAIGTNHLCVMAAGRVGCMGANMFGQLGNSSFEATDTFVQVFRLEDAVQLGAGGGHTCALRATDAVFCWGANDSGQLGNGSTSMSNVPVMSMIGRAEQIAVGGAHTCAIADGSAWCWGDNARGQLGDGTTMPRRMPTPVMLITDAMQVACGAAFTCFLRGDGSVWCTGSNSRGQLGDGTAADSLRPNPVMLGSPGMRLTGAVEISVGQAHACARMGSGLIVCWGDGSSGQLGAPIDARSYADFTPDFGLTERIALGAQHTTAMRRDGQLFGWGNNNMDQLFLSGVPMVDAPQRIAAGAPVERVWAGGATTCIFQEGVHHCAGRFDL